MMIPPLNWTLLMNSLFVAGVSSLLAFVCGIAYALVMSAAIGRVRQFLLACAFAVMALPAFLVTNSWIDLLGTTGLLHRWIPLNVFSLSGTIWILSLMLWPLPAIAIWSAWPKIDCVHFEVDPALRGFKMIELLLWPAARSHAFAAVAVVFALAISNFTVPAILQVKVFPAEAWVQFNTNLDAAAAWRLGLPLLVVPLVLLVIARQPELPWPRQGASDFAVVLRHQLGLPLLATAILLSGLIVFLALVVPLGQLLATPHTWQEFVPAFRTGVPALMNSLANALSAVAVTIGAGLFLARVRWLGWLWLLFFLPGILLGISAVHVFNRPGLEWFSRSSLIVIAVLSIRYVALSRSICRTAFRGIDLTILDAGRLDGAKGWTLFRRIALPQVAPEIAAAAYLVYLLCLWDVETILMVLPPGGETLALRIFNLLHYGHNDHVNALCLLLLLAALAPLALFILWNLTTGVRWRRTVSRVE